MNLASPPVTGPGRLAPTLLAVAAALACAAPAQAQSVSELYERARGYDAMVQSSRLAVDAARFRAEQSRALRRPSVDGTVAGTQSFSNGSYASSANYSNTQLTARVDAGQSLFNRPNDKTIAQAERNVDVTAVQQAGAEQDLIVRVAQAYFDALAAQDALDTVRASKRAIAEQLASAKRSFEVGTTTVTDTREAQARYDLAQAQELAAENDLNTKKLILEQLVGVKPVEPVPLALPVVLPVVEPASPDEWVRTAENANPQLKQLQLALDVARLETEKAQAGHLPTARLVGSLDAGRQRFDLSGMPAVSSRGGPNAAVGVQMNVPIFAGWSVENRVKEASALEDKARSDLEAARRTVAQNAANAYFGLQSLRAQVAALEAAEASSKLALEATQLGYKVGVRVNLDVLNATTQLYQTRRDLAKARYDVIVNMLKLKQAAGVLQPADVQRVDALLARRG